MKNIKDVFVKKNIKWFAIGAIAVVVAAIPIRAAMVARETPMAGTDVVVNKYCENVANGSITPSAVVAVPETATVEVETAVTEIGEAITEDGHVKLNLNYSRLGIASKVDTYLNVRSKPSKKGRIIGKMTKNSGCHVYKIKDGWAKIISGKVKGYVKSKYLVTDKAAEKLAPKVGRDCVEVGADSLRVRALPSMTAPIYTIIEAEEEFQICKENLNMAFIEKIIKKQKISKKAVKRSGGMEEIEKNLDAWICIMVDDDYAFVPKEFVTAEYSLKRAVKVKKVSASKSSGVSSGQASIVEYAKKFLGNRYVWGGSSLTGGTDCSGFTMSLYARYGHSLPHNAAAQAGCTRSVSSPKPGDLFFYSNGSRINHVAMYIGGGMVIHASNPTDGIKISTAYYRHPVKIGRVMN